MHQKHPKIKRPQTGYYARVEFAFVGTTCERMDPLMEQLADQLSAQFRVARITGDHQAHSAQHTYQVGEKQLFSSVGNWNDYDDRLIGTQYDLVLVNGNHYPAARQIVFIDPNKAGTLERRKEQLTDVAAIVMCPGADGVPGFLGLGERPIVQLSNALEALLPLLQTTAQVAQPPLKALILAGGQSTRMGDNKAELVYRAGQTEAERLANYCAELGLKTYFSLRDFQETYYGKPVIQDRFLGLGPMGAIASAFLSDPEAAWLVLACDLPLLEKNHLQALIDQRDSRQFATAVQGASQPFPEPLIAIYEPRAYSRLLQFLTLGYACPRKLLINSDTATLKFIDETPLTNANTPEEREKVRAKLAERG